MEKYENYEFETRDYEYYEKQLLPKKRQFTSIHVYLLAILIMIILIPLSFLIDYKSWTKEETEIYATVFGIGAMAFIVVVNLIADWVRKRNKRINQQPT